VVSYIAWTYSTLSKSLSPVHLWGPDAWDRCTTGLVKTPVDLSAIEKKEKLDGTTSREQLLMHIE
jgi:hypothetical protein